MLDHPDSRCSEVYGLIAQESRRCSNDVQGRMDSLRAVSEPEAEDTLSPANIAVTVDDILEGIFELHREEAAARLRNVQADISADAPALAPLSPTEATHLQRRLGALAPELGAAQNDLTETLREARAWGLRLLRLHGDDEAFRRWMVDDNVAAELGISDVRHIVTGKILGLLQEAEDLLHEPAQHLPLAPRAVSHREVAETLDRFSVAIIEAQQLLRTLRLLAIELEHSAERVAIDHLRQRASRTEATNPAVAALASRSYRRLLGQGNPLHKPSAPDHTRTLTPIQANAPNAGHGPALRTAA